MDSLRQNRAHTFLVSISLVWLAISLAVAFYAPLCMYYEGRMRVNDYGIYTNFIWNSAHGEWFRYLTDHDYLKVHLSFTLLLLAPLFLLWDHPYLLALVQSSTLAIGALIVWRIARRLGVDTVLAAALTMLFAGYALVQRVVLCDFHGVCLYFILLPCLYYTACFRRSLVWLPLFLTLGLREDAGLTVIPLLAYLSAKYEWKAGWIYTAVAVVYTAMACTVLFEWINGFGLSGVPRRGHYFDAAAMADSFHLKGLQNRFGALFWLYLPALPWLFHRRMWIPIVTFPLLALLPLLLSLDPRVHGLQVQYPVIVFVSMFLGILEAIRQETSTSCSKSFYQALGVVGVTALSVAVFGVGYRKDARIPWVPSMDGRQAEHVASLIPRDGHLLTTSELSGFCSNRRDLLVLQRNTDEVARADHVFIRANDFENSDSLKSLLNSEEFGVSYFDLTFVVLSRGANPADMEFVRACARNMAHSMPLYRTLSDGGRDAYAPECGRARVWDGGESSGSNRIVYGRWRHIPAGHHRVLFRLKVDFGGQPAADAGRIELYSQATSRRLLEAAIQPGPANGTFFIQELDLVLEHDTRVEPRVYGGAARIWLDEMIILPAEDNGASTGATG